MAKKKAEKPQTFLKFRASQKSPTLEIGHGEYTRKFDAKEQPFEVDEQEAAFLKGTGYFVDATPPAPKKSKSTTEKSPRPPAVVPGPPNPPKPEADKPVA